ncbi:phage tail tube protein [Arthrobacter sp. Soil763]|uniref:phage tail tube protein n=1 Tax=Arthrobacter sp. Soil763 TaxID=1736402 RepID=UPI0006F94004|nr:IPT/TIG domain-containing protein [Arthrobacter sp. Soil763]KRE79946.1 hypothetical protein ASG71_07890 [Arthrobacter sp. Soil763]
MTTELARRFRVDVSTNGTSYVQIKGVNDFNPQVNNTEADASAYDTDGWGSTEITLKNWSASVKTFVRTEAGVLDPGIKLCRDTQLQFGDAARLWVRTYDRNTGKEAREGRAIVSYNRSKSGVTDLDEVQIEFKGDGPLLDIADVPVTVPKPVVLSASPDGATAGEQVTITGANFVGVTGVKFGATNAASYTVVSANTIVAVVPAGTAGSAVITVTNATGTSDSIPYTRGA